eukprot:gnl/MRDRNA2_/MRDRNA2_344378_c0_seq1.p1 gnl/MRDRNA2_/MRDRNA2_344378_c0~~gnl/MRDRNA2_/MRDRNA2_344378_c0_seq1.p1  ORF type:complete len:131 (-),score=21.51 gnl/MRDRNA2_/MRDRNA2_344378_c0_seq1:171-518(-)
MAVVDNMVADKGLSVSIPIWVYTFANSQFGEDFGAKIEDSPFYQAVCKATWGIVLVVDREASSLQCSWCSVELFGTSKASDKKLEVYTPCGMIGSRRVSSGPLVDAVKAWDVRKG